MGRPHRTPCDLSQQAGVVTLLTNVGSAKVIGWGGTCSGYAWETRQVVPDRKTGWGRFHGQTRCYVHESKAGSSRKGVLKTRDRVALERTGMLAHFREPVGSGVISIGEGRGAR